ncbi:unnamed protein product [Nezara viridula]|uniref:Uncharacterized protein n=1 Tax=Nezara viridula TaxID=85310 RepID=A0A9P0H4Z1_NEZVI|nr:unnamed protein product [Nezara viridula]
MRKLVVHVGYRDYACNESGTETKERTRHRWENDSIRQKLRNEKKEEIKEISEKVAQLKTKNKGASYRMETWQKLRNEKKEEIKEISEKVAQLKTKNKGASYRMETWQKLRNEKKEEIKEISEKVAQLKTKNKGASYRMETCKSEFRLHEDDWDTFIERPVHPCESNLHLETKDTAGEKTRPNKQRSRRPGQKEDLVAG